MIKKTFYNLPYEKRKRITDAVIKEFMELSLKLCLKNQATKPKKF